MVLRHLHDPEREDLLRAEADEIATAEPDLAEAGSEDAADRGQQRRLAGPVRAYDAGDAAFLDREPDALQDIAPAVASDDALELEECGHTITISASRSSSSSAPR